MTKPPKPRFFAQNYIQKGKTIRKKNEDDLQLQFAAYLQKNYPNLLFTSDIAGRNLSKAQQSVYSMRSIDKETGKSKKFPDMLIFEPSGDFCGLAIELKQKDIHLKDGSLSNSKHIQKQLETLKEFRSRGWYSCFAVGIEQCLYVLRRYADGDFYEDSPYHFAIE